MFNADMKKNSLQAQPFILNGEANRFSVLGAQVSIQARSEQTGGGFNLFDVILPRGYETSLHIHYAEEVAIWVLEGTLALFWGTEQRQAETGSFAFQPRGTPHGFRVLGARPVRILYMSSPGGLDEFVLEHTKPVSEHEKLQLAARYKIEVLGPLPE